MSFTGTTIFKMSFGLLGYIYLQYLTYMCVFLKLKLLKAFVSTLLLQLIAVSWHSFPEHQLPGHACDCRSGNKTPRRGRDLGPTSARSRALWLRYAPGSGYESDRSIGLSWENWMDTQNEMGYARYTGSTVQICLKCLNCSKCITLYYNMQP
jgi:hypothetical protein